MNTSMLLAIVCWLLLTIWLALMISALVADRVGWSAWEDCDPRFEDGDRVVHAVRWRRNPLFGLLVVEYEVDCLRAGGTPVRNDLLRAYQHGVSLRPVGRTKTVWLLRGATVRLEQTFETRDGSSPLIRPARP
ncbi:hypothetical protein D2E22_0253 [Bifidobacterium castoris]|uniref:Uncharacterized protein n=2 Tax=Bifidobacterium castoris TaxID=2306972 RepID=A0A430FAG6_9BIFI|nr:hypothetical protein D2E22_0253 [Bifidobacterium castoris]